ncbi:Transposon Ty3-I Gag-Pol polyprotein [Cucumis melo var. makuwa]|uniref:Transposon Ty3-I Gag-Pol polyprotein n=1 Tax=Cucumis melo var. makuwa TaxID=1194695 RepID=A0A5D3CJL9_CUCMM|nr:Transposon Ty3-I Gag-Pol polyprotein [Cucumis melo var. makuwa]TYK10606.1 Transposon Ty3-I Gag-Pol polyprotein [Cucumis melo var. makuwa]
MVKNKFKRKTAKLDEPDRTMWHHQITPRVGREVTSLNPRNTVDTTAEGALADKTPTVAQELISIMAENSQSFGNRASELDNSLTKECGVCGLVGHPNDKCPEVKQQMTQLATAISKIDGKGKLPAQSNHANVSAISLRSGRILDTPITKEKKVTSKPLPLNSKNESKEEKVETSPSPSNSKNDKSPLNDFTPYIPKPHFPSRLDPKKKETPKEEELLEMFRKVQINLPLLDAIQQVPRHAKFLKELCTNKRKTKERPMKLGIELKTLPPHLKYIFLGKKNMFPIIISRELNQKQEERLIEVLKKKKQAIGWTLDDIKGISPTFCMHRIILEEGAKEKIQPQRRVNPTLKEVVMKEVLKLKDARIIYPVPNSSWVSPIHVVAKKIVMTVMKNDKGEIVPMRMKNGWRMCIDYRKLNDVTKKDHLPLPFLDQMIERLAEFNLTIKDRKGVNNSVADHLSRIVQKQESMPIREDFSDEHLFQTNLQAPWYADIVNYLVTGQSLAIKEHTFAIGLLKP